MQLISHNSFTFAQPKKWWMRLLNFSAKCQDVNIGAQYEKYGIRAFDLRLRFHVENRILQEDVVHGLIEYDYNYFSALQYLNEKGGCIVRVIHDVRTRKQYEQSDAQYFRFTCQSLQMFFKNIKFFGGTNLYNGKKEYDFGNDFSIEGCYGSQITPTWFWGLYPRLYAFLFNKKNIKLGTDKDLLMIDFVNYN